MLLMLRYSQSENRIPHVRKRIPDGATDGSGDPFIYNPYAKKSADGTSEVSQLIYIYVYIYIYILISDSFLIV
jgi:hypothetical protein